MAKVALRAGESKALISYHFGSKQGLVAAAARQVGDEITAEVLAGIGVPPSVEAIVEGAAAGVRRILDRDERIARAYFDLNAVSVVEEDVRAILREVKDRWREVIGELLRSAGVERRRIGTAVMLIMAGLEGLTLERIERGETAELAKARKLFVDSVAERAVCGLGKLAGLDLLELLHAALVSAALELGREPDFHDLLGEARADDPRAHREDVRVVVQPREASRVEVVAKRGTGAAHLVRGELLALSGAPDHDAALGVSGDDLAGDARADRRVVDGLGGIGAEVDDLVAVRLEQALDVLLELEPRVVGADRDPHGEGDDKPLRAPQASLHATFGAKAPHRNTRQPFRDLLIGEGTLSKDRPAPAGVEIREVDDGGRQAR